MKRRIWLRGHVREHEPARGRRRAAEPQDLVVVAGSEDVRLEQLRERHRESAIARTEVSPIPTLGIDTSTKEADELSLIHVFRFRRRRPACPRRLKALRR